MSYSKTNTQSDINDISIKDVHNLYLNHGQLYNFKYVVFLYNTNEQSFKLYWI